MFLPVPRLWLLLQMSVVPASASFALRYSKNDRRLSLAMTSTSRHSDTSASHARISPLYATRGGRRGKDCAAISSLNTNGDSSNSITSQLALITQPLTSKLSASAATILISKKTQGRVIPLFVAFLYGTLNGSLRGVYATEGPPVASVLSVVWQCLTILTFIPIFIVSGNNAKKGEAENSGQTSLILDDNGGGGEEVRPMWLAAAELAFLNLGSQGFVTAGLLLSPAARASFLTQTSVVMTPVISAFFGERVRSVVWVGCAVALLGLFVISTATSDNLEITSAASALEGDVLILLGALSWSFYIFRTSKIASFYPELELQFTKTAMLAVFYAGWFITTAASALSSAGTSFLSAGWAEALTPLWAGWKSPFVWLILVYSAIGPGAGADVLQQIGQKETSASESNIILCMESVFAAVCAYVLLGEVSSMQEMIGGFLIVVAAILASKD